MDITIKPAGFDEETAFRNVFQFYVYEFSRFMRWRTTQGGRFIEADLDGCWDESSKRHPFLIYAENDLAGMAIIDRLETPRYSGDTHQEGPVTDMGEFFIMAAFQGQGIGRKAAGQLFDRFPGRWHVHQLKENSNAMHFWRKVIQDYTAGNYHEIITPGGDPVQFFTVSGA